MKSPSELNFIERSPQVLEQELNENFTSCKFGVATEPLNPSQLSKRGQMFYNKLGNPRSRKAWLLGRHALLVLAKKAKLDPEETLFFSPPHPNLSLTHKSDIAVAVFTKKKNVLGIGIDYEPKKKIPLAGLQHFLNLEERRWIETKKLNSVQTFALWTVKEAVYKSLPNNSRIMLPDIEILDLGNLSGHARVNLPTHKKYKISFQCISFMGGFLSVAMCYQATS